MLQAAETYEALYAGFRWSLPGRLNLAHQVCDCWLDKDPDKLALIDLSAGARNDVTYRDLATLSYRVQAALIQQGVEVGDRVGVLLSQSPLCAAAHIAIWRMGAISVPLFKLFKEQALHTRISDAECTCVVSDDDGAAMLSLMDVSVITGADLPAQADAWEPVQTSPETPALLMYTSGTTGSPKGALHGHRVLTGHLPGVEISHNLLGQPKDVIWTPADWAWIGGLFDVLMPGLALGVPVVAARMPRFDVETCAQILRTGGVTNVFFPPTALRMLRAEGAQFRGLRSVASGGEPLGAEMLAWGREAFGLTINEFYGQTECNMVASSCASLFDAQPGCVGRAVPGFDVAVIDDSGQPVTSEGDIAIRRGAASMMLGYWNRPKATADKFRGDWMIMGDRGVLRDGFLRFVAREDDVITSAGYRIGPAEIEDCLLTHPDVATVGVVGKPDPLRTEIVKAYVVCKPDSDTTAQDLQSWVKNRLATYSYPREITFVDALPMTVTGKVIRKDLKARAIAEYEAQI